MGTSVPRSIEPGTTFAETPMTSTDRAAVESVPDRVNLAPTATPPGQKRRAAASLTIATGRPPSASSTVKVRPCRSSTPSMSKKFGVTPLT